MRFYDVYIHLDSNVEQIQREYVYIVWIVKWRNLNGLHMVRS